MARLFKRLREVQGKEAADEVVRELESFLKPINAEALASLHEAGDELTALHSLNVPNTLHKNLLSTNAIENSFRNTRRKIGRVTRFRAETNQATRWLAFCISASRKRLPKNLRLQGPARSGEGPGAAWGDRTAGAFAIAYGSVKGPGGG